MSENPSSHLSGPSSAFPRSRVNFANVQVFYFSRAQGFSCVPTRGGSSLGMVAKHWGSEEFNLDEHETIRRYERYHLLMKKYRSGKLQLSPLQVAKIDKFIRAAPKWLSSRLRLKPHPEAALSTTQAGTSADLSPNAHTVGSPGAIASPLCDPAGTGVELGDAHGEEGSSDDELSSLVDCYALQLLSVKKRRLLLAKSGLKHIDPAERAECQAIRESREICGCSCPNGICLPDCCQCSLNGVPCQIDHTEFPCSCSRPNQCVNPVGRTEFNPLRVRAHYIHTQMQLETGSSPARLEAGTPLPGDTCTYEVAKRSRFDCPERFPANALSNEDLSQKEDKEHTDAAYKYNSTLNGGCRLCQNDQFVHLLTRNLVFPSSPAQTSASVMLSSSTEFKTDEESIISSTSSTLTEFPGHLLDQSMSPLLFPELGGSAVDAFSDTEQTQRSSSDGVICDHLTAAYFSTTGEVPMDTGTPFSYPTPKAQPTEEHTIPPACTSGLPTATHTLTSPRDSASRQRNSAVGPLAPITSLLPKLSRGAAATASKDGDSQPWSCCTFAPAKKNTGQRQYGPRDSEPQLPATDSPTHIESQYSSVAEEVRA